MHDSKVIESSQSWTYLIPDKVWLQKKKQKKEKRGKKFLALKNFGFHSREKITWFQASESISSEPRLESVLSTAGLPPCVCEEFLLCECTSVHVQAGVGAFAHQLEAFWTGPRVKGSANTLSLSAARVITPVWNYSTFVYRLPWAHCK